MTASAGFRLSPQQRRLWQLQSRLGQRTFRARALARVRGALDLGLLRKAVENVAGQYEILRTTFPCPAGLTLPVQRVADEGSVAWHEMQDLSGLGTEETEASLDEILRIVAEEPFDFARGPLLRLAPAVLSGDEHALVLVLPSLCADAVTLRNLVHQIAASYVALAEAASELERSSALQYIDIAEWQNELLEREETALGREHWESWDPAVCRALRLPFEAVRTNENRFEPRSLVVSLESGLAQRAAALAAEMDAPLPTLLLAAWQSLLWRLLGQSEIVVGLAAECRSYEGLSESLGPLASFVPLACRFDGDLRFTDAVARTRDAEHATAKWQEYFRWESVAERHGLTAEETVFPVSFAVQDQPAPWRAGLLEWALPRCEAGIDRFRLGLEVRMEAGRPAVDLAWDAAVISRDDAEGVARAWRALLASAVARPEARLGELALADPDERLQLAQAETAGGAAAPALVHELFVRQVRRVPERAAVVCAGKSFSYAELAERSHRLARLLRRHGVAPDVLVALCLERSLAMPLAVLGVLEAGGAYLPLDPALPRERKSFLLKDARPQVILTESRFLADLPAAAGVPILCLDAPWEAEIANTASEPDGPAPDPRNLAYVIYTSGSTGAPKGVAVEHRQLANYVQGVADRLDLPDGAVYAMVSTFAADLGNTVLFPSLCGGGTLHLIPDALTSDPVALAAALEHDPVDCLKITPSHLEILLAGAPSSWLLPRRCLVLGGEASRREWVEGLTALHPGLRVLNHYGPTETTVGVLTHWAGPGLHTATLPLGRPLPGIMARLLEADLTPLPAWFPGEIYLGGAGVARGYLGRPDLTAERFLPDPLAGVPGARMYRTGDLAHRLPDGALEFIGRADNQVKVRGFRIELGEIEKALEEDPEVRRAAVAARDDGSGSRRLVAYVVAESRVAARAAGLRERLRERLPEFMVPSAFLFLDALPLNANGKVDRRALPEPDWRHLGAAETYVAPETPTEEILAHVWSEVLGVERVGARDNFFLLGGDSIRGIVARVRAEEQGVIFSIEQLFNYPGLRDLARVAGEGRAPAPDQGRTEPFALLTDADRARLPEGIEDAYPLAVLQAGMLFHSEVAEGTAIFHDLHSAHLRAPFALDRMRETVRQVSLLHPVLRTSFNLADFREPLQLVHTGISVPLEVHNLRLVPPEEQEAAVSQWLHQERQRAFDWTQPPLIEFHVHLRGEESFQFTMSFHHAILDGWSSASLLSDLFRRYTLFLRGEEPPPDVPLAVAYRDFVALERAAVASEEVRNFWRRMLDGAEPARLPRPSAKTALDPAAAIRSVQIRIDPALSTEAQRAAREAEVPLKSLLLAVFLRVLSTLGGTTDFLTALISHGRPEHADGERVLGLFLNTLPLRVRLHGGSWRNLAQEIFDLERRMLPFRHFPFAEMQRMEGGRLGLEVAFNYLHYHVYRSTAGIREIEVLGRQDYEETNFPLAAHVSLDPFSHHVWIGLNYRTSELDAEEVERFADYLLRALTAMTANLAGNYDGACLLSEAERQQIIAEWGNGGPSAGPLACFDPLFAEQARRTPEAVAVAMGDLRLTYRELDRRVDRMAQALALAGVGPDEVVPLLADRGPDFLTAVLALFRVGGAYLPLDPLYPVQRIVQIVAASGASRVLASQAFAPTLVQALTKRPREPQLFILEDLLSAEDRPSDGSRRSQRPLLSNLAYVIYTSGSTGVPKGAMLEQRGMVNHLWGKIAGLGLGSSDRVAQTASQCFDISVWQFLAPLLVGGQVRIFPDEVAHDALQLLQEVERQGITLLETVPSLLRLLLAELDTRTEENRPGFQRLRWLIPTGEALPPDLCRDWLRLYPAVPLLNAYGPTECSDDVAHHSILASPKPEETRVPIGRPVPGLTLYLLDSLLEPLPAGVAGELFVGGVGVGRGYLGDGARTADSWRPNPISVEPGARLYRTGDLARYRPAGEIEYLGRIDHQVKVRGHRIELGEIEAVLADHPEVRAVAVTVRGDAPGQERLVAYAVPYRDEGLDQDRVGRWEAVFDEIYGSGPRSEHDTGINLRVWISSYTGESLPESEIFECFEDSVARILALRPSRVLEIGCGTGLLLLRIAPHCAAYTGTDVSDEALRFLGARIAEQSDFPPVDLLHRTADDFAGIPPSSFDIVVLNEVAQYFPSVEYLVRVVEGAVAAAAPGGSVFLGGLRSFPLLEAFHTSVELFRAPAGRPLPEVREAVRRRLAQDKELAVDPALFEELVQRLPRIAGLSIQLKGGRARNELTGFRYDAVLRIEGGPEPALHGELRRAAWEEGWTLDDLRRTLAEGSEALAIRGVPNARLLADIAALRRMRDGEGPSTAGELRAEATAVAGGVEPADLWDLAAELGWEAEVRWSTDGPERLDALFHLPGVRPLWTFRDDREEAPWSRYANRPERGEVPEGLLPQLRAFASERLPDWMVPAAWVLLEELPLTPNGKLDRKALPAPDPVRPAAAGPAPRGQIEEMLAAIWAEVLGLERIGATDHFFDLGGHSLLATQVMSRLRSVFGVEMPLRNLFEAPVLADLAARVETALRAGSGLLAPPLVPVPRQEPVPLSFAQQRLWFIDQLEPGSPLYSIPVALRVEGPLRSEVLALCLGEIVRRHETLRTVFADLEGSPVQVIQPAEPFRLPVVDLSGLPERERETLALTLTGEEAAQPFDLRHGPLLRGVLLRLAERDHIAALTMHHIVSDGWSMGILVREVTALYPAFAEAKPSPLPELPVQYADFAVWQRSWLHGDILEGEVSFWRRQLAGLPPLLNLPTDRPRPAVQSYRGATRPVRLPAELTRKMQVVSRREGATLFMVLVAGFQALLARWSGQQDLAVGTPVAGRNWVEIEGAIGFFVNTLVLRGDLSGEPSFRELLGRVRETALAAHMHQEVPFESLVKELSPERSLSHTPLFQVMFVLQNTPIESLEIQDLRLRPVSRAGRTAKFDLTVGLQEHGDALAGTVEYATGLFDTPAIHRLLAGFERLLAGAVADPDGYVADLPLLSPAELHQVRIEWNPAIPASGASLVEMFESWADRMPAAPAVLAQGEVLTYSELDDRANQLARHLRALGVTVDSRVGLCVERSPAMIAAVLGILKAGAAYVPLDPAYPRERLAFMIEDARVPVLLTQERLLGSLPESAAVTLRLDAEWSEIACADGRRLSGGTVPESLAYVIYTSGSTGRPKGVMVHHRGLGNLAVAQRRLFHVIPGDRVLQFASLSFDASASEIAMTLGSGATLVLGPPERRLSREELTALLRECTIATLPPTTLAILSPDELPGLETLVVAGEACPLELAQRWSAGRRLINAYGPTEASVCATAKLYDGGERLPIGWPVDRVQAYVLDAQGNPVPLGVAGELCLGGPGLARGYLNLPEQTARSFVPHSFAMLPGERLYRTGDLAFRLPDGELEFLGRIDHQVKVRGFRIELGEIETALASQPGVREAVVVVREDRSGGAPSGMRLVAYVVGDVLPDGLRKVLRERLPDYMMPAAFVTLAALPLTPNGKVDRKALPALEHQRAEESWLAPRTPVEEVLAGIWAELLSLERVGAAAHFFDLGGHSLLATRVMSRLRSAFGVEMPLRDLFETPVLADLAARVEAARWTGSDRLTPPLVPVPREGALPLSFAQQRLWFIDQLYPGSPVYNVPVALRFEGPLNSTVLALSLGEIVRRHSALRTVFTAIEGSPVQVIRPATPFRLPVVDLSGLPARKREALALTLSSGEAARPFDLTHDPLLRAVLLRLAESDHVVALTMHHIASDAWSIGILVREVTPLYAAFAKGRPSPLPELPVQYADFAVWQNGWLNQEALKDMAEYWRKCLAGAPPQLDLPGIRPRPAALSPRGAACQRRFSAPLLEQLRTLSRRESATLFMILLASLQALLHSRTGATDLVVGTDVAGRGRRETEGLVGFFINQLPLRADLAGNPTLRELLGRVRETALDAYAHQDLPFDHLVEALRVEQSLRRSPVFQVKLVLQNAPRESLDLSGLTLKVVPLSTETAQLDLHWNVVERGEEFWLTLTYSTDLYDEPLINGLLDQYELWLHAFAERPDAQLGDVVAELAKAKRARRAERGLELKSKGLGKLRGLRRQAEELKEA